MSDVSEAREIDARYGRNPLRNLFYVLPLRFILKVGLICHLSWMLARPHRYRWTITDGLGTRRSVESPGIRELAEFMMANRDDMQTLAWARIDACGGEEPGEDVSTVVRFDPDNHGRQE